MFRRVTDEAFEAPPLANDGDQHVERGVGDIAVGGGAHDQLARSLRDERAYLLEPRVERQMRDAMGAERRQRVAKQVVRAAAPAFHQDDMARHGQPGEDGQRDDDDERRLEGDHQACINRLTTPGRPPTRFRAVPAC